MLEVVTGSGLRAAAQPHSGAADWKQDAVRPKRRSDLTERNRSIILCFLELDIQVRTTNQLSCDANLSAFHSCDG